MKTNILYNCNNYCYQTQDVEINEPYIEGILKEKINGELDKYQKIIVGAYLAGLMQCKIKDIMQITIKIISTKVDKTYTFNLK